ncbi:hypothetical protein CY34DRAFT_415853 [Suillus luteus UH-Slu-Lm8-n1]|uniref:Uncharacterized protein n=1 Tax=Suillus luteus UH-Slu-Lm8-n1 TaxID=930992 RepID=A0A0D0AIT3_9AGAM|nr:hypothetical protein CY34DRAFT_415853 [Suillus luteus UH-Slu-Lm8-n1]
MIASPIIYLPLPPSKYRPFKTTILFVVRLAFREGDILFIPFACKPRQIYTVVIHNTPNDLYRYISRVLSSGFRWLPVVSSALRTDRLPTRH